VVDELRVLLASLNLGDLMVEPDMLRVVSAGK
jgi:hypothetical protein